MKSLRRVVIIGNGYDIAHGLESSYNSFILNYFKTVFNKVVESGYYDDELISIDCSELFINKNACFILIKESDKLSDLFKVTKLREIKNAISFNNDYFKELISESIQNEKNWIDIEKFYYNQLTFILRLEEQYRKDKIIDLNNFLDLINVLLIIIC